MENNKCLKLPTSYRTIKVMYMDCCTINGDFPVRFLYVYYVYQRVIFHPSSVLCILCTDFDMLNIPPDPPSESRSRDPLKKKKVSGGKA